MKKSIGFAAAISLLIFTGGCAEQQSGTATSPDQEQKTENQNQDSASPSDKKAQGDGQQTNETGEKKAGTDDPKPDQSKGDQDKGKSGGNKDEQTKKQPKGEAIPVVSNPESVQVLVNKSHRLPEGYIPPNLVYPDVAFPYKEKVEKRQMRKIAAEHLEAMFKAAKKDGIALFAQSGYRSYARQKTIYDNNVDKYGLEKASIVSAYPGTSEHQTGLTMDITSSAVHYQLIQDFGATKEGKWVADHAHEYGFIVRYPKGKTDITGYEYEPWHLRYVGKEIATAIHDQGITLEQYLGSEAVSK